MTLHCQKLNPIVVCSSVFRDQIKISHNGNSIPSLMDHYHLEGRRTDQPGRRTCVSGMYPHAARGTFWRSEVLAADAKKAESASEVHRRMPRPSLRMGKLDWIHCVSESDELVMELTPSRNRSSTF